ncbi:BLUF domain-containing protein [Sphingobium sp. Ant17]|uniref:BLUF domain-containing protein n=1 Tax=Sphingobium sp. Ant17 TaxID=1461752 RepID=UPI0012687228|nr:BLUF domain-containing protein [Sphingobium sp. Ant17]
MPCRLRKHKTPYARANLPKRCRKANSDADRTGLLEVGGRRFLEVVEGPEPAVIATYELIRRDPWIVPCGGVAGC